MKILLGAGIIAGLLTSASAQAQIVDLGIETQTTEKAKPSVDSLPEIKNLRAEKKAQQTQEKEQPQTTENTTEEKSSADAEEQVPAQEQNADPKEEKKGFFSFLNFFKKDDEGLKQEAAKNQETFVEMLTRQANEGNVDAQLSLGYMYLYGDGANNVAQDYKKSFEYYEMAAKQGDIVAINNLGSLYYSGIGTPKDMNKAAALFAQAADKGNEESALNLAFLYLSGNGVAQDNHKAMDYFVQAGQKGNLAAQFMLGYAYYRGFIVPQDYKRAFTLMRTAAKAGYDDAQLFTGLMYLTGDGTTKNYGNAVTYLGHAFLQGNVNATVHLANIYAEGKVYPKNILQAYMMYSIAANNGVEEAATKRDALESGLKIEELLKAQAAAEKFAPKPTELTTYIRNTFGSNIFSYIADQMPEQYIETPEGSAAEQQNKTNSKLL